MRPKTSSAVVLYISFSAAHWSVLTFVRLAVTNHDATVDTSFIAGASVASGFLSLLVSDLIGLAGDTS